MRGKEIGNSEIRRDLAGPVERRAANARFIWESECAADHGGKVGHKDFDGGVRCQYFWGTMNFCAVKSGALERAREGSRRVWNESWRSGDIEQPVVAVHFPDRVRGAVMEDLIEVFNLILPFSMRTLLALREEKALARVETAINGG